MKSVLITALNLTLMLMLAGCGSGESGSNDLIDPSAFITEADNTGNGDPDSNLLNGRHAVNLGSLELQNVTPINYDIRTPQVLYVARDNASGVVCVATLSILLNNAGPNPNYEALIEASLAQDDSIFTISITDISGPTNVVGIEYRYGFVANGISFTSLMHAHYLSGEDVTFNIPALTFVECASPSDSFSINEPQIRAVMDSVDYLRGNEGSAG